jgi:Tfp pilus assembly protein PilO
MRRTMLLALIAVLVVFGGWYEGLYHPETSHITKLKAAEQLAQVNVLTLETRYADLVKSEKKLPAERAALAKLERAVPNDPDLDSLVKTLFSATAAAKVTLASISSPQPADFGDPLATTVTGPIVLALTLSVSGTSSGIEQLYRVLDAEPRLFVINNFSVLPGTGNSAAALDLDVFYASPSASTAAS